MQGAQVSLDGRNNGPIRFLQRQIPHRAHLEHLSLEGRQPFQNACIWLSISGGNQVQDQVGLLQHGPHPLHTQALYGFCRVPQSRCIEKSQGQACPFGADLQHIPRGAWDLRDDGAILPGHGVEECAFPGIGPAHKSHPDAIPQPAGGPGPALFHMEHL